jgi:hypothetical protein
MIWLSSVVYLHTKLVRLFFLISLVSTNLEVRDKVKSLFDVEREGVMGYASNFS